MTVTTTIVRDAVRRGPDMTATVNDRAGTATLDSDTLTRTGHGQYCPVSLPSISSANGGRCSSCATS